MNALMNRFAAVSLALGVCLSFGALNVRAEAWQPSPGHSVSG